MDITCINCPVGCRMQVTVENGVAANVTGYGCKRGLDYAKQEAVTPLRMVTAVVEVEGGKTPLSVKTKSPVPKKLIFDCMRELNALRLSAPIQMGQVVCPNVCGTGVDVIATKTVEVK